MGSKDMKDGSVKKKKPELWPDKWILRHNNVPVHEALMSS
jgi:hypothetical protein